MKKKIFTRRKPIWEVKERGRDGEREREGNQSGKLKREREGVKRH